MIILIFSFLLINICLGIIDIRNHKEYKRLYKENEELDKRIDELEIRIMEMTSYTYKWF